eukprot:TRINITY_DN12018_c0_g1_i7.p1 TRINITY_DN12018_c0_g1~~TRINITY_DN12018_c0_g1_i7.p1  ORF type:complete len:338 (+),score=55.61 TRINITY_DN12018_c0_g1_i7:388-1401(+)
MVVELKNSKDGLLAHLGAPQNEPQVCESSAELVVRATSEDDLKASGTDCDRELVQAVLKRLRSDFSKLASEKVKLQDSEADHFTLVFEGSISYSKRNFPGSQQANVHPCMSAWQPAEAPCVFDVWLDGGFDAPRAEVDARCITAQLRPASTEGPAQEAQLRSASINRPVQEGSPPASICQAEELSVQLKEETDEGMLAHIGTQRQPQACEDGAQLIVRAKSEAELQGSGAVCNREAVQTVLKRMQNDFSKLTSESVRILASEADHFVLLFEGPITYSKANFPGYQHEGWTPCKSDWQPADPCVFDLWPDTGFAKPVSEVAASCFAIQLLPAKLANID